MSLRRVGDCSMESFDEKMPSQTDLSLFDEEIIHDPHPNKAYFNYMVCMKNPNDSIILEGSAQENPQAQVGQIQQGPVQVDNGPLDETNSIPLPPSPARHSGQAPAEEDLEVGRQQRASLVRAQQRAQQEQNEQECASQRQKHVPPVIYVGEDSGAVSTLHYNGSGPARVHDLSTVSTESWLWRNRRPLMCTLVFLFLSMVGLIVGLVVAMNRSNGGDPRDSGLVGNKPVPPDQGIASNAPTFVPSQEPLWPVSQPPTDETVVTEAPVVIEAPSETPADESPATVAPSATMDDATEPPTPSTPSPTTATTNSPTTPLTVAPTMPPTDPPTVVVTKAPTVAPTNPQTPAPTISPTPSPTKEPTPAPVTERPTSPPVELLAPELEELIDFLSDESPDGGLALSDRKSPQFRAAAWLSEESDLDLYSDKKVIQRYVLSTFFFSTKGDSWFQSDGWLSESDECTWFSSVDEDDVCNDGELVRLKLKDNNIQGTIPPELSLLSDSLVWFEIHENSMLGTVPTELGHLTKLERLTLKLNANVSGPLPTELGRMTALTFLGLGRMSLTGTLPSELGQLERLETLGLERNEFTGMIPSELGLATALTDVALDFNRLTGDVPQEILDLPLDRLAVNNNDLTGSIGLRHECYSMVLKADCDEVACACCTDCCYDDLRNCT